MNITSLTKTFLATAAIAASTLTATAAQALQLTTEQWADFNSYVQSERVAFKESELQAIRPETMRFVGGANPLEVYFINEGAGYKNQLLYSVNGGPLQMIFDNVSSPNSILKNADGPLALGEGKSLGNFADGTQVDFFLNSDGYTKGLDPTGNDPTAELTRDGSRLLGADADLNRDGLQHIVAYAIGEWMLIGFEDIIGGGDLDYNDTVFAVRGVTGKKAATPEPGAIAGLAAVGLVGMIRRRKQALS